MNGEKKVLLVQNILISLLMSVVFTLLGQYFGIGKIIWSEFFIPFAFGTVLSFLIVQFIPIVKLGVTVAFKLKAKPNTFIFLFIVSFIVALIFVPLMVTSMSIFSLTILGKLPIIIPLSAAFSLKGIPLIFIIGWPVVLIITIPCEKIARAICKVPKPDYNHEQQN